MLWKGYCLDKVNDTYIVSIGTNSNITLLLQSLIWILLLFSISKKRIQIDKFGFVKIILITVFLQCNNLAKIDFIRK